MDLINQWRDRVQSPDSWLSNPLVDNWMMIKTKTKPPLLQRYHQVIFNVRIHNLATLSSISPGNLKVTPLPSTTTSNSQLKFLTMLFNWHLDFLNGDSTKTRKGPRRTVSNDYLGLDFTSLPMYTHAWNTPLLHEIYFQFMIFITDFTETTSSVCRPDPI